MGDLCRAAFLLLLVLIPHPALAGDWPQILGPNRNGRAEGERLAESWPAGGPKVRWQRPVGKGYAGVAVANSRVIVHHRLKDQQLVEALDAANGKPIWKYGFLARYRSGIAPDDGPRCVPLIHDGAVYVHSAEGDVVAIDLKTGRRRWERNLAIDYDVPEGYFGAGSTPIVVGERLLVNVGGREGAGIVAVALADGKTVWKATDDQASYSSPTLATVDGVRHAIFVTRLNAVSLNPDDGAVRFTFPFGKRGPTVNAATPLVCDGKLFVSASYEIGSMMTTIGKDKATPLWTADDAISSQYATSIYDKGRLYGIDGRSDDGLPVTLRAVDAATGKVLWKENVQVGHLLFADGKLIMLLEDGTLKLAAVSPKAYRELATAKVLTGATRALPALAAGALYVRDTDTLKCLDLAPTK
jgi:outer membrane protein assembly factor BamB